VKRALVIVIAIAASAGCAEYGQSKIELAEQARRGVKMARDATERREQQLAAFDARQRTMLDAAFDADVLDALRGRRLEAERAKQRALENLDAVDRALVQLQQMQQAELKLSLPEVKP
jgi:flagellar motility protein MotE (MotC chaperone)